MILVECRPDFILIKTLTGLPKRQIPHHQGKPEICKSLKKSTLCKGLIDEDPGTAQPPYLNNLEPLKTSTEMDLKVLADRKRRNLVIILCPKLEDWIIKSAKIAKLNMEKQFRLPHDSNRLHRIINYRLANFQQLLETLRGHSPRINTLEKYLKLTLDNES